LRDANAALRLPFARRDPPRDQLALDRHVFFHAQLQHEVLHAMAAEDAH